MWFALFITTGNVPLWKKTFELISSYGLNSFYLGSDLYSFFFPFCPFSLLAMWFSKEQNNLFRKHVMLQSQQKYVVCRVRHLHIDYSCCISCYNWTALCADQESASSLPVRGSHQEKMKAPRQEASLHYRLSVNSTQASFGKMRVEFGWRAFLKRDDWRWNWKKSLWAWKVLIRKKKAICGHNWRKLCVFSVCPYMAALLYVFCGPTKACPNYLNRSWHDWRSAHARALDYQPSWKTALTMYLSGKTVVQYEIW